MELGSAGLRWFRYVPEYDGNREQDETVRLSVEIRKLRMVDVLGIKEDDDSLFQWRDQSLQRILKDSEYEQAVKNFPARVLSGMRQFCSHTRNFRNWEFDGEPLDDAALIFLNLSIDAENPADGLLGEVNGAITTAASLYGEKLKNYVQRFALTAPGSVAQDAPGEPLPQDANTPQGQNAP